PALPRRLQARQDLLLTRLDVGAPLLQRRVEPLEASLHHLEVGQDQLGLEVFAVAPWRRRVQRRVRERTHNVEQGIGVPEFFGVEAGSLALGDAGQVDYVEGREGRVLRLEQRAETIAPRFRDTSHPRVDVAPAGCATRGVDT